MSANIFVSLLKDDGAIDQKQEHRYQTHHCPICQTKQRPIKIDKEKIAVI